MGKENTETARARAAAWYKANIERARANMAAWTKANREKCNATAAAWAKANPEKAQASVRAWQKAHPEKMRTAMAKWRKAHQPRCRADEAKRRALKRNAIVPLTPEEQAKIIGLYAEMRALTEIIGIQYHVDHIVPLSKGGLHHPSNLQILRGVDNLRKGAKLV